MTNSITVREAKLDAEIEEIQKHYRQVREEAGEELTAEAEKLLVADIKQVWGKYQEKDRLKTSVEGISAEDIGRAQDALTDETEHGINNNWKISVIPNVDGTVTFRRVQGGEGNKRSRERIIVNPDGSIHITAKDKNLNVSVDNGEHARYFSELKRNNANIVEFEEPDFLYELIKETAIEQNGYSVNPRNQSGAAPQITDIGTPGISYELPYPWPMWLEEYGRNARIQRQMRGK